MNSTRAATRMLRTTIADELWRKFKSRAAAEGRTLGEVLTQLVAEYATGKPQKPSREK